MRCDIFKLFRWIGFTLLVLLVAAGVLAGADQLYQVRGDRFEGIVQKQHVSGAYFELLGVHVRPSPLDKKAETLHLTIPMRTKAELTIRVWEPERSYWMVPKRKEFLPGTKFSWPRAEVLGPLQIDVRKLCILVTDATETLYYPARLFSGEPPTGVESYVFLFKSRGGVELEGMIASEEKGRLVLVRKIRYQDDFGGILSLTWDGRSTTGERLPPGIYHLKLAGIVFLKNDHRLRIDIPFLHHGKINS